MGMFSVSSRKMEKGDKWIIAFIISTIIGMVILEISLSNWVGGVAENVLRCVCAIFLLPSFLYILVWIGGLAREVISHISPILYDIVVGALVVSIAGLALYVYATRQIEKDEKHAYYQVYSSDLSADFIYQWGNAVMNEKTSWRELLELMDDYECDQAKLERSLNFYNKK